MVTAVTHGEPSRTFPRKGRHRPSPKDRAAARRTLARLKPPEQIRPEINGCANCFRAIVHAVSVLMEIGQPLPRTTLRKVGPWIIEIDNRRREIIREAVDELV